MKLRSIGKPLAVLFVIIWIFNMSFAAVYAEENTVKEELPVETNYTDENGETQTAQAATLTAGNTELPGGWYVVNENSSLEAGLKFSGDTRLIIGDGFEFSVRGQDWGIFCGGSLTVYGQIEDSGVLTCSGAEGGVFVEGTYTHIGGFLNSLGGSAGICAGQGIEMAGGKVIGHGEEYGIKSSGDLLMSGGELTGSVYGTGGTAVFAKNNVKILGGVFGTFADDQDQKGLAAEQGEITLSWTDALDSIYADTYNKPVTFLKDFRDDHNFYLFPAGYVCEDTGRIERLPLCPAVADLVISFDAGGGSGEMEPEPAYFGRDFYLPECGFAAPAGKTFDRWNLGEPGELCSVTENIMVRALWKALPGSVSGNSAEETSVSGNSAEEASVSGNSAGESSLNDRPGTAASAAVTAAAGEAAASESSSADDTGRVRPAPTGDESRVFSWIGLILVMAGSLYVLSKKRK